MNRLLNVALAASVSVVALTSAAEVRAAEVYRLTTDNSNIIVINGDIDHDTTTKVRYALGKFNNAAGFVINSAGGSMLAARELQRMVIGTGKNSKVSVPAYGTCASACVDVLFIANTPQAHTTSRIGVHLGVSMATGAVASDPVATRVYRARGVPESVITKMNTTAPKSIAWLSSSEFQSIPGTRLFTDTTMTIGDFIERAQYRVGFRGE